MWTNVFLIKINILWVLFSLGSAEADVGWGGKLNGYLMASSFGNIYIKIVKIWQSFFWLQSKMLGMVFETQCSLAFKGYFFVFMLYACVGTYEYMTGCWYHHGKWCSELFWLQNAFVTISKLSANHLGTRFVMSSLHNSLFIHYFHLFVKMAKFWSSYKSCLTRHKVAKVWYLFRSCMQRSRYIKLMYSTIMSPSNQKLELTSLH